MLKRVIIFFILINIFLSNFTYATEEIINSQMEALNISSFIKEGQNYTKEIFPDLNLNDFFNSALNGEIDNKGLIKSIVKEFSDEILSVISLIGSILIVIVIHSLLKSFIESLNNKDGVAQIAYYIEYILIVTLIMSNFSNIINIMKDSIENLVGFVNSLVPILLALMAASR